MRIGPVLCGTAALLVAVTSCSDNDDSSDSGSGDGGPSGTPINLGLIANTTSLEELSQGAQIAIDAVNAAGGVQGRPLNLVTCDNELNANAAAACAREMADDENLLATVGNISSFGGDTNPILEAAQIAGIGTPTTGSGDFASPIVFPVTSGGQIIVSGAVLLADELEAEEPGVVVVDTPTANALPQLIDRNIFAPRGLELAATASIPGTAADVAPQAAALADTDGIVVALTSQLANRFIQTARQQGYEGDIVVSGTEASPESVEEDLAGANEDLYVMSSFDNTSPGFEQFMEDVETYDSSAGRNDTVVAAYLSVKVFAEVAQDLPTLDRASVLAAMSGLQNFDTDGLTLPLDYTTPGTALGGQAPRLFDFAAVAWPYRFEDGEFVPVGDGSPLAIYGPA